MPDHSNTTYLIIGLVTGFAARFVLLLIFLRIMILFQKMNFTWLPLIGAAFLAASLDMIPMVGHYVAVPALYLCIWKITHCELYPDAVFTVALSYALTYMITLILLAYAPVPKFHPASAQEVNFDDLTNAPEVAMVQPTNEVSDTTTAPAPASTPPDIKFYPDLFVKGVSGGANSALVTVQCEKKNYVISLGEGATVSTSQGQVSVRLVEVSGNNVTLAVNGQAMKYTVN